MATKLLYTTSRGRDMIAFKSEDGLVADTIDMVDLDPSFAHCFLSVQILDVSGNPVLAGAGTFAVSVYTVNNNQPESPAVSSIDGTAPVTIDWAANTTRVTVVPTGITTAISYRVVLTTNRS